VRKILGLFEVLSERLSSNSHDVSINEFVLVKVLENRYRQLRREFSFRVFRRKRFAKEKLTGNTTDLVNVFHDILSGRLQVGEERYPVGNGLNIVDREFETDGVSDSDQVKDGVRGSTKDHGENLGYWRDISSPYRGVPKEKEKSELTIAFSKASRVMISRGLISFLSMLSMTSPTESHSSFFSL
jgi:hypothetical protein